MALFNRHTSGTQYPISNITVYWESLGMGHLVCLAWATLQCSALNFHAGIPVQLSS